MSYRTTCPHCNSVLGLGADQLAAAEAWVQCGVCGNAFDAHPSLLMADGTPVPVAEPDVMDGQPDPTGLAFDEDSNDAASATEAEPETIALETDDPGEALVPHGIVQRETPLDLPSIILIDPDAPLPDDPGPLPHIPAPAYPSTSATPLYPAQQVKLGAADPVARVEYAQPMPGTARLAAVPRRSFRWGWLGASLILLMALLAQATYFLRDTLVSRLPQARPALEQACAAFGCMLSLPRNLSLLQVVGSDLQTEARGRLKLSLTLGNRATHVQAWPVLVLTLTDQRNRPLARRSFAPSEYLGDARRIADGMPPRSEQALVLPLTVRDLAPMGFDLRLVY